MENQIPSVPENLPETKPSTEPVKEKLTMKERFLKCSPKHNRLTRSGFFMNIIALGIIFGITQSLLKRTPDIITISLSLIFWYLMIIQTMKRCHDFGKKGIIASVIVVLFGFLPAVLPLFFKNPFEYAGFMLDYYPLPLVLPLLPIIPLIIIALIPGNKEVNQYGESFGL